MFHVPCATCYAHASKWSWNDLLLNYFSYSLRISISYMVGNLYCVCDTSKSFSADVRISSVHHLLTCLYKRNYFNWIKANIHLSAVIQWISTSTTCELFSQSPECGLLLDNNNNFVLHNHELMKWGLIV